MKTVHVVIEGRVQGVFFRDYTQREATRRGLKGWVRNLPNGMVDAVLAGTEADIDEMIEWFSYGSPMAEVASVEVDEILPTEKLTCFTIRY